MWGPDCEVTVTAAYRNCNRRCTRLSPTSTRLGTGTCSLRGFTDIRDVYSVRVTLLKSCSKSYDICACCGCETSTRRRFRRRLCNPGVLRVEFIVFAISYIGFIFVMILLWFFQILFMRYRAISFKFLNVCASLLSSYNTILQTFWATLVYHETLVLSFLLNMFRTIIHHKFVMTCT